MSIKRFPFKFQMMYGSNSDYYLFVVNNDHDISSNFENEFELGLPVDMVAFIHIHCKCAFCESSISRNLAKCNCGKSNESNQHLVLKFPIEIYHTVFRPIVKREQNRIRSIKRKQRIEDNGGSYSKDDISKLFNIQGGCCYFCGVLISMTTKASCLHIDHYQAISQGGKNDISNIVLTCSQCNLQKGKMHGNDFEQISRKNRSPEFNLKLKKTRNKLNEYWSMQTPPIKHSSNLDK